jgi:hypothetical protein
MPHGGRELMGTFLATHTYLAGSLAALAVSLVALQFRRSQRAAMLWSGLLAIPWAMGSLVLEVEYWQPRRIAGSFTGVEDVICSFSAGVFTWLVATSSLRPRLAARRSMAAVAGHLAVNSLIGVSMFAVFRLLDIALMAAISCSMVGVAAVLAIRKPRLWTMPLLGGLAFPFVYLAFVSCFFGVWPHALEQWNLVNLSGVLVFGVPVEEVEWAIGFGTMWPLLMAHALDVRLTIPATGCAGGMLPTPSAVGRPHG